MAIVLAPAGKAPEDFGLAVACCTECDARFVFSVMNRRMMGAVRRLAEVHECIPVDEFGAVA